MNNGRKVRNNFDEDYSKIKPGYAPKRQGSMPPQQIEFVDTSRQDKLDARSKALIAQAQYKFELDSQLKSKQIPKSNDDVYMIKSIESNQNGILNSNPDESDNPNDDDSNVVGNLKITKNMTEAEIGRLAVQKQKQQDMKDYLDLQVKEKQIKKRIQKEESDDFAKGLKVDAVQSVENERQNKWASKERQQQYSASLQQQIVHQQTYKKTSLW